MAKTLVSKGKDQLVTFKLKDADGVLVTGQSGTLDFTLMKYRRGDSPADPSEEAMNATGVESAKAGLYAVVVPGSQLDGFDFADLLVSATGAVNDIIAEFENSAGLSSN